MDISFENKRIKLNIFHTALGPVEAKCISFVDEDILDIDDDIIASIMISPYPLDHIEDCYLGNPLYDYVSYSIVNSDIDLGDDAYFVSVAALHSIFYPRHFEFLSPIA